MRNSTKALRSTDRALLGYPNILGESWTVVALALHSGQHRLL